MKDLPHHIKKLNRRVIRSAHREELEEEAWAEMPPRTQTQRQLKKQAKQKQKMDRQRPSSAPNVDEQNRLMKKRVPIFDRTNNAKPKTGARPTSKKTPRI